MSTRYGDPGIRRIIARHHGHCDSCDEDYPAGTQIVASNDGGWVHTHCYRTEMACDSCGEPIDRNPVHVYYADRGTGWMHALCAADEATRAVDSLTEDGENDG